MPDICDNKSPEPIEPLYATADANSPITFYVGPMTFDRGDEHVHGNGELSLEWLPSPRFRFRFGHRETTNRFQVGP